MDLHQSSIVRALGMLAFLPSSAFLRASRSRSSSTTCTIHPGAKIETKPWSVEPQFVSSSPLDSGV